MRHRSPSHLHLLLGQEVIYLLLAAFALISLSLTIVAAVKVNELKALKAELDRRMAELAVSDGELSRLRRTLLLVGDKSDQTSSNFIKKIQELDALVQQKQQDLRESQEANARLNEELRQAKRKLAERPTSQQDKPPIINLKETEGFSFPLGEAVLTPEFKEKLSRDAVPAFLEAARQFQATVIEVVGHTDELPIAGRTSNLDTQLIPFLKVARTGGSLGGTLVASDNAGLGMARAAAVAQFLMNDSRLAGFQILPLSGAQIINSDDTISMGAAFQEASKRRRIELRARRSNY